MNDELAPELEEQLRRNDTLNEWLGELRFTVVIVERIDDALILLATKRETLEEKMITKELHLLVAGYAEVISLLHQRLSTGQYGSPEALEHLRTLNFAVHASVNELLKALRYNLNYVEQYFEFEYCAKLTQEEKFSTEVEKLIQLLRV